MMVDYLFSLTANLSKQRSLPATDRIGGLIQLQVDGKWIQTETVSTLQMVAKDTPVNKVESPLFAKNGTLENKSTDEGADSKVDEPTVTAEAPPEKSMFEAPVAGILWRDATQHHALCIACSEPQTI